MDVDIQGRSQPFQFRLYKSEHLVSRIAVPETEAGHEAGNGLRDLAGFPGAFLGAFRNWHTGIV